ncbi:MAG TPA: PQQ-binding-like beta-propeller repeat protein [Pseudonocardiaceae bacterium]|nr:PQQ-binding-like beta-propeller repeat protein [Pseudonocardiaceae bacterium]
MRGLIFVVALMLVVAGCTAAVPGVARPQPTEPSRQWAATGSQYNGLGVWIYSDELVVATDESVTAYDRASGSVRWARRPPAGAKVAFCGASTSVADGVVSLGYGAEGDNGAEITCDHVTVLDLGTGKLGWTARIPDDAEVKEQMGLGDRGLLTEVVGTTVVVGWAGVVAGYDISSGARKYHELIDPTGDFSPFDVRDITVVGPTAYFLVDSVVPLGAGQTPIAAFTADAATGREKVRANIDTTSYGFAEPHAGAFVSTAPLTALVYDGAGANDARYLVFNSVLGVTATVDTGSQLDANSDPVPASLEAGSFTIGANPRSHQLYRTLVTHGTLYSVTLMEAGNQLVAYDIRAGTRRWSATLPNTIMMQPVATDGSALAVAAIGMAVDAPVRLVRVDLDTGRVLSDTAGRLPVDHPGAEHFWFVRADNRLYAVEWDRPDLVRQTAAFAIG